ncbi:thiolase family protein [Lacisediminihabitans profunda]|uniref:Thiolase family protein n=1 Tax=Lacisediminihabitans profunda TaxID=2594790 RepID=A0A5C8UTT5_9MICO|nr:thiolase family protein [Lacisediminihabitans profunda]TXN31026.1 thiolase family protein [Lacisediminihabitans profunda]
MSQAVIVDVVRSASGRGKPGGQLSGLHPVDLLATVLYSLVERNDLDPGMVDDVIGGCLSQVGQQSVNITRNAVLAAGFPESVPGTTVDRQCGSSQQAAAFAAQGVIAGAYDIVIACGVEQMSRNPINFATLGEDPWGPMVHARYPDGLVGQGVSAELIAARWDLSREQLDEFSARSHRLAAAADFSREIVPVGDTPLVDETIRPSTTAESLGGLKPAFFDEATAARFPDIQWRVTPGNSSPLTDGASAALIMSEERAASLGLTPRARFRHFAVTGSDPIEMLTGVMPVTRRILERSGMAIDDFDSFEVNEAFACVPLAWQHETGADPARVNQRGGAIALGHPLGASGTRLLTTLVNTLEQTGGRFGLQTMCEGAGMANATIIERI